MKTTTAVVPKTAVKSSAVAQTSKNIRYIISMGASEVPRSKIMRNGVAFTVEGAMYVTDSVPQKNDNWQQGIAIRNDGAVRVNSASAGIANTAGFSVINGRLHFS